MMVIQPINNTKVVKPVPEVSQPTRTIQPIPMPIPEAKPTPEVKPAQIEAESMIESTKVAIFELFDAVTPWAKKHSFALMCVFGAALFQYIGARERRWLPVAVMGTIAFGLAREILKEKEEVI